MCFLVLFCGGGRTSWKTVDSGDPNDIYFPILAIAYTIYNMCAGIIALEIDQLGVVFFFFFLVEGEEW